MNWALMVSDFASRAFGLVGLMATVVAVQVSTLHWVADSDRFLILACTTLFMFFMTATFLLPRLHDSVLRRCMSSGPRVIFVIATGIWIVFSYAALTKGFEPPRGLYSHFLPQSVGLYIISFSACLFLVFICPLGLMFRTSRKFFVETGVCAPTEKRAEIPIDKLRNRDYWDFVVELPLYVLLILPCFAVFFVNVVPTVEWNEWVRSNFWIALTTVALATFGPLVLRTGIRPPHKKQKQFKTTTRILALLFFGPIMAFTALWTLWHYGVPSAWNYLTENPTEIIEYEVTDVSTSRRTRGCVDFKPLHAPDLELMNCGLESYWASRLEPGDIVRVSGELSWFGHNFEHIELLSE